MKDNKAFKNSLPMTKDGIVAKSGTMSLVKGYTGYAYPIAFAILINNEPDQDAIKNTTDKFLEHLSKLL